MRQLELIAVSPALRKRKAGALTVTVVGSKKCCSPPTPFQRREERPMNCRGLRWKHSSDRMLLRGQRRYWYPPPL